jgi:CO/xanthine dehydrogenase Mo-binding subunit
MKLGIGLRVPRLEAEEKLNGRAQYIADLSRPGMLYAALLGSLHAHAKIKGYDLSAALAMPGVHTILTGADFPDGRMGAFIKDEHAIAKDKVRYLGEPVAVVAAQTEYQARAAAQAIVVDYEELPAILQPEDALRADAPIIHEDLDRYIKVFDTGGLLQMLFGSEQQIDEISRRLSIDPFELRRKNIMRDTDTWFGGGKVGSNGLAQCLDVLETASDWKHWASLPTRRGKKRRLGVAIAGHISGLLASGAIVRMLEDGTIILNTGATDIGQGSDTALAQMVCEVLQVPLDKVSVASPDTDGSPYNWGTTASRGTFSAGRSVVQASTEVKKRILEHASELFECAVDDVELRPGGKVGIKGVQQKELEFSEISRRAHWAKGGPIVGSHTWVYDQPTIDPKRAVAIGLPFPAYGGFTFAAVVVDVEVDEATGQVKVLRAWSAIDVGKAVNPSAVEGQIEGAFAQGMGFALAEEMVWDGARLANPTLMDYKVPTSWDVPYEITSVVIEAADPDGPFGAKGCGEIGINAVPAAIANAVTAATGVRYDHLPLKPERVLRGMLAATS